MVDIAPLLRDALGMAKKDFNVRAFEVVEQAIGERMDGSPLPRRKNHAAVALGRLGGQKGGRARAEKLSAARRSEIARVAASARWNK